MEKESNIYKKMPKNKDLLLKIDNKTDKNMFKKVKNENGKEDVTVCVYPTCNFEFKIEIRILLNRQKLWGEL